MPMNNSIKNKILSISGQNPDMDIEDWINYDIFLLTILYYLSVNKSRETLRFNRVSR